MNKFNKLTHFIALLASLFLFSCGGRGTKPSETKKLVHNGTARLEFLTELHNFGELKAGEQISFSFKFQNTGDGILKIDSITNDCGCMVVSFPKEDVQPGENNYVDVLFNSAGEYGRVFKQIQVFSNSSASPQELAIVAEVENQLFN